MYKLWGVAFLFGLLAAGVFLAPIPSEAAPNMKIDGQPVVGLQQVTCTDSGYNLCFKISGTSGTGLTIGSWLVKDVSATNVARVLINDVSTTGGVDAMKLTGVTFTPVTTGTGSKQTTVVITNTFNTSGGNPAGDYVFGMGMSGYYDPPQTENVVGNRLKADATGDFGSLGQVAMGTLDTGTFTSSTLPNQNTSVSKSLPARVVKPSCNMSGGKCFPTITWTFTIIVAGNDTLVLTDSPIVAVGTCREQGPPPTSPDTTVPNGPPYPLPPGPVCNGFQNEVNQVTHKAEIEAGKSAKGANAPPAQVCTTACGTGTIKIIKKINVGVYGAPDGTFGFSASGDDMTPAAFDLTTSDGFTSPPQTYSNVSTGPIAGSRTITEVAFPDTDGDHFWRLDSVICVHDGESSTSTEQLFDEGDALIGVKINNLDDNDTLTCEFTNNRYNFD